MRSGPPKAIPPGELFALIMQPRPVMALEYESPAIPGVSLYVRAIQASALVEIVRSRRYHRLVGEALSDCSGEPLFSDPEKTLLLREKDLGELKRRVEGALDEVCPTYQFSEWPAWKVALSQGMMLNGSLLMGMQAAFDLSIGFSGGTFVGRPDRYFGKPVNQLLDGHLMAFSVVHEWMNERRGK